MTFPHNWEGMTKERMVRIGVAGFLLFAGFYVGSVYRRIQKVDALKADLSPEEISVRAKARASARRKQGLPGVDLPKPAPVLTGVSKSGYKSAAAIKQASSIDEEGRITGVPGKVRRQAASWRSFAASRNSSTSAFLDTPERRRRASSSGNSSLVSPAPAEYEDPAISAAANSHLKKMAQRSAQDPSFDPESYVDSISDYQERAAVLSAVGNVSPETFNSYGQPSNSRGVSGGRTLANASAISSSLSGGRIGGGSSGGGSSGGGSSGGGSSGGSSGGGGETTDQSSGPPNSKPKPKPTSGRPDVAGKPVVDLKLDPKNMKPSGPAYAHDKGKPKTVQVYSMLPQQKKGPLYFKADMDIDADGAGGHYKKDKTGQSQTSLRDSNGRSLNPGTLPFFVLPSDFPKTHPGVKLGDIALVQFRGKQAYAIYGDNGPKGMIGEGSIALAEMLGIDSNPNRGGTPGGVTYIVFPGSKLKKTPTTASEVEAAAQPFVKALGPEFRKSDLIAEPSAQ